MTFPPDPPAPSDALVVLLTLLHDAPRRDEFLEDALILLEEQAKGQPSDWDLSPADLYAAIGGFEIWPPAFPDTLELTAALVATVQILDRWHAPICVRQTVSPDETLVPGLDQVRARIRLEDRGRFNTEATPGSLVPMQSPLEKKKPAAPLPGAYAWLGDRYESSKRLPPENTLHQRRILHFTLYLPDQIAAGDPAGAEIDTTRRVRPIYRRISTAGLGSSMHKLPIDNIRVAIAPLAEDEKDLSFEWTKRSAEERYWMTPRYNRTRIELVIEIAILSGIHLLFLPEMAVAEEDLEFLKETVFRYSSMQFQQEGHVSLRYVFVGVAAGPDSWSDPHHRNYIAILDFFGELVGHQHKLTRWDLPIQSQQAYGLPHTPPALTGLALEDIKQAEEAVIFDLDGIGRMIILICADMDHNRPGDWLVEVARPDWVYAPVMDSSTCWAHDGKPMNKWIVARAYRLACHGRGRVVVSNSVAMTRWRNATTMALAPVDGWKFQQCGIGLLLDGSGDDVRYHHLTIDLSCDDRPSVEIADWLDGWSELSHEPTA